MMLRVEAPHESRGFLRLSFGDDESRRVFLGGRSRRGIGGTTSIYVGRVDPAYLEISKLDLGQALPQCFEGRLKQSILVFKHASSLRIRGQDQRRPATAPPGCRRSRPRSQGKK